MKQLLETIHKHVKIHCVTCSFKCKGQDPVWFCFAKQGKLVSDISLQVLEAKHERELKVGVLRQQFDGRYQWTPVSEQSTIKVNAVKCTHLEEPCKVVCVFSRHHTKSEINDGSITSF